MGDGFTGDKTQPKPDTTLAQGGQPDWQVEAYDRTKRGAPPPDATDRTKIGDPAERRAFQAEACKLLDQVRSELEAGSTSVNWCNKAASHGIRPTTTAYKERFESAKQAYARGIDIASVSLYECYKDTNGNVVRRMDPITGRPIESAFNLRLQEERRMLAKDIAYVDSLIKQGKGLSQEDMRRLGMQSPDAAIARQTLIQMDRVCQDDQRLLGYGEANLGMALIRLSPNHTAVDVNPTTIAARENQRDLGRLLLEKASQSDPWMLGPPPDANYLRNRREVELIASAPIPGQVPDKTVVPVPDKPKPIPVPDKEKPIVPIPGKDQPLVPVPGKDQPIVPIPGKDQPLVPVPGKDQPLTGVDRMYDGPGGTKVIETQGRRFILDGTLRLPTGNDFPDPANTNFRDPLILLEKAKQAIKPGADTKIKVSGANKQSFEQAIAAADELDRIGLRTVIGQGQTAIRKWLAPSGPETVQETIGRANLAVIASEKKMKELAAGLAKNPEAVAMLDKLRECNTPKKLQDFYVDLNNKDAIQKFNALDGNKGKELFEAMADYLVKSDQCGVLTRMNEEYASSLDTRAFYLAALLSDQSVSDPTNGDQPSKECIAEAQKRLIELVQLDSSLLKDKDVQDMAKKLGVDLAKLSADKPVPVPVPVVPDKDKVKPVPVPVPVVPDKEKVIPVPVPVPVVPDKDKATVGKDLPKDGGDGGPPLQRTGNTGKTGMQMLDELALEFKNATDKKEVMKKIGPQFKDVIIQCDKDFEAAKLGIVEKINLAEKKMERCLDEKVKVQPPTGAAVEIERGARIEALGAVLNAEKVKLTADDQGFYNEFLAKDTDEKRRQQIQEYLTKAYPALAAAALELATLFQPVLEIQREVQLLNVAAEQALKEQFNARLIQTICLEAADDLGGAKIAFQEAINQLPPEFRARVAQDPPMAKLAEKLGVDMRGTTPAVPVPSQLPVPGTGQPDKPGQALLPKDTGSGPAKPDAPIALEPQQLLELAKSELQTKGIDHAKKYFEQAIKAAEAQMDQAKLKTAMQAMQKALRDNVIDGRPMTPGDRWKAYQLLDSGFAQCKLVLDLKVAYANQLQLADQQASAQKVLEDVVKTADELPIAEMHEQIRLITLEMSNKEFASSVKDALLVMAVNLNGNGADNGLVNLPINKRKELIGFYLGVGKDEKGEVKIGVKHLKSEEAIAVIEDTKKVYRTKYNIDLDANPGRDSSLADLTKATVEHLPDALKKKYESEGGFFKSALANTGAAVTGLVIAGILASLMTRNPSFARGALATSEGLTFAGRTVVVTSALATSVMAREGILYGTTGKTDFSSGFTGANALKATANAWGSLAGAYILLKGPGMLSARSAAAFTPEATLARLAQEVGTFGEGGKKVLTLGRYVELAGQAGVKLPEAILAAAKETPKLAVTAEMFALEGMQAANMMAKLMKVGTGTSAAMSNEAALAGIVEKVGVAGADGQKALTLGQYVEAAAANGIKLSDDVLALAKAAPHSPMTPAMLAWEGMEATAMTTKFVPAAAEAAKATTSVLGKVMKPLNTLSYVTPRYLNPATATPLQIGFSRFGAQYTSALVGLGLYNSTGRSVNLLDQDNPRTQKPYTYAEAVMDTNFGGRHSKERSTQLLDNVFTQSLLLAPFLAAGPVRMTPWTAEAGYMGRAGSVINPLSTRTAESIGSWMAKPGFTGLRPVVFTSTLANGQTLVSGYEHRDQANYYQKLLEKTTQPLSDADSRPLAGKKGDTGPGAFKPILAPGEVPPPPVAPKPTDKNKPVIPNPYSD